MNKDTIELDRRTDFPVGYGVTTESFNENTILNKIVEWSKLSKISKTYSTCAGQIIEKESNSNKKVYKHLTRVVYENISQDRFYKPFNGERGYTPINLCDRVVYLDIYWQ